MKSISLHYNYIHYLVTEIRNVEINKISELNCVMFFEDGMVKYEMKIGDFSITNCESLTIFTTFYYNTNIHTYI